MKTSAIFFPFIWENFEKEEKWLCSDESETYIEHVPSNPVQQRRRMALLRGSFPQSLCEGSAKLCDLPASEDQLYSVTTSWSKRLSALKEFWIL